MTFWLLGRLAAGPPRLFRLPRAAGVRLLEDWVHHEDVRRANGKGPRPTTPEGDGALLDGVRAVMALPELAEPRRLVEGVLPDGTVLRISDEPRVRLTGPVGEILLFLAGRPARGRGRGRGRPGRRHRPRGLAALLSPSRTSLDVQRRYAPRPMREGRPVRSVETWPDEHQR